MTTPDQARKKMQKVMKTDRPVVARRLRGMTKARLVEYALDMREGYFIAVGMLAAYEEKKT